MFACRICQNTESNKSYLGKERLYGTFEEFEYIECSNCGCLQIKSIPENITEYYPDHYMAYKTPNFNNKNKYLRYLQFKKVQHVLGENRNFIGWFVTRFIKDSFEDKLAPAMVKTNDRILDVGTGKGQRITRLRQKGFKDITGTDIFIKDDIYYDDGLRVLKMDIRDIEDTFDFVMLNHVFEHMPEPLENLKILHKLVKPGKYLMIRIPVADSYSWEEYRTCWYALDPPRHFYLHTRKSMQILAEEAGFRIDKVIDDSSEIQFIGSEQYKKGIASFAENSYFINPSLSVFSRKDISTFRRKAKKLNLLNEGDSRCFYLFRP